MSEAVSFGKSPFTVKSEEKYSLVTLVGDIDVNIVKELEKKLQPLSAEKKDVIFDCKECSGFHPSLIRPITQLVVELKKAEKSVRFAAANQAIQQMLVEQGVNKSVKITSDFAGAVREAEGGGAKRIDVKFANAFLNAAIMVMKVQAQTEVKAGAPVLRAGHDPLTGDISGVIGLVSDAFNGAIVINFPEQTFLGVISRMLGEKFEKITPEITDGAAELTNIIFGQAKVTLNELGYGIKMATPSVVTGKGHSISNYSKGPRLTVPFTCDLGAFTIEICLS